MPGPRTASRERPAGVDEARLKQMIARAKEASVKAYCPYSNFRVGAAVLTTSGEIYTGCNVENASSGLTICAERNAIFHARCEGMQGLAAVVVYTQTDKPTAPCGACRQVINEFGPEAGITCVCDGATTIAARLADLLPQAFGPDNLR